MSEPTESAPKAQPAFHSRWKAEEILGIIPGAERALEPNGDMSLPMYSQCWVAFAEKTNQKIEAFLEQTSWDNLAQRPSDMAEMLSRYHSLQQEMHRAQISLILCQVEWPHKPWTELGQSTAPSFEKSLPLMERLNANLLKCVSSLSEEEYAKLRASASLRPHAGYLDQLRYHPQSNSKNTQKANALMRETRIAATVKLERPGTTLEEKKLHFAEGLQEYLSSKLWEAKASGFADDREQYRFTAGIDPSTVNHLLKSAAQHHKPLFREIVKVGNAAQERIAIKQYTFQEVRDIVVKIYTKLHPEFGKIARRAFDEGWIRSSNELPFSGMTYYGVNGHPFIDLNFSSTPLDVIGMAHEMAHAIHIELMRRRPSLDLQNLAAFETFSHFAERLAMDEMLAHTANPAEAAATKVLFLAKQIDNLGIVQDLDFENRMYQAVREGKKLSYAEQNKLYIDSINKYSELQEGQEPELIDYPGAALMLQLPPHNRFAYPLNNLAAGAFKAAYDANPKETGEKIKKLMEEGSRANFKTISETLLGYDIANTPEALDREYATIIKEAQSLRSEIEKLPPIPPKVEVEKAVPPTAKKVEMRKPTRSKSLKPDSAHIQDRSGRSPVKGD